MRGIISLDVRLLAHSGPIGCLRRLNFTRSTCVYVDRRGGSLKRQGRTGAREGSSEIEPPTLCVPDKARRRDPKRRR
jgi:hypothetical protein